MIIHRRAALAGLGAAVAVGPRAFADNIYLNPPESVGFTQAGLDNLNRIFRTQVDQRKLAGIVTLVARHGRVVNRDAYGKADVESGAAITHDTIFRIASMTKPICGLAMMQLWEQGKWKLTDPVHKFIPEFRNLKVRTAGGGTENLNHAPTMAELMSHSAGFGASARYNANNLSGGNLQDMINILKDLPLYFQPGTDWEYGPSVNIQGHIVEKLSGMDLSDYMQKNIFDPLEMADTQFWAAPAKASRVARVHNYNAAGQIQVAPGNPAVTAKPKFLSGSGGLYSTVGDYYRFAQTILDGGRRSGKRVLRSPDTVRVMHTNVLHPGVLIDLYGPTMPGLGFGMDYAVVMDPAAARVPFSKDTFYWGGAFGTAFWIDPVADLIFVGMIQNLNGSTPNSGTPLVRETASTPVYAALGNRSA